MRPTDPCAPGAPVDAAVLSLLEAAGFVSFPVDLMRLLKARGVKYYGYRTSAAAPSGQDGYALARQVGSAPLEYLILINERNPAQRIRWTIAHELGHIMLGHFERQRHDHRAEREANHFAKALLMPLCVLDHLRVRSPYDIARRCDVSLAAARNRAVDFAPFDERIAAAGHSEHELRLLRCFKP